MTRVCARFFLAVMLLMVSAFAAPGAVRGDAQPVTQVRLASGEWEPWLSETLPRYGLASEIVTAAFAQAGITVHYGFFDWPNAYQLAKDGVWDGTLIWISTPERRTLFVYSDPFIQSDVVFFHRKQEPFAWTTWTDLKGKRIGVSKGYNYGAAFQAAAQKGILTTIEAPSDERNMRRLIAGEIDLFPVEEFVGLALVRTLREAGSGALTYNVNAVNNETYHLLISRKNPRAQEIITVFNRGLAALQKPDPHDYIQKRYPVGKTAP